MIDVKKLYFSYTDKPFVENVSFHVGKGEIFGFLGPSGAGKSTIQKVLTGLNTKYKGSVKLQVQKYGSVQIGFMKISVLILNFQPVMRNSLHDKISPILLLCMKSSPGLLTNYCIWLDWKMTEIKRLATFPKVCVPA